MYLVPELVAGAVTAALQLWRRNPLVSILAGTAVYMTLIRLWPDALF
jgi:branched-subunit amino acid transport protein AzlD